MKGNRKLLRQLKSHFVLLAMLAMFVVTAMVVGAINVVNYYNMLETIHGTIELISFNDGSIPGVENIHPDKPGNNRPDSGYIRQPDIHVDEETPYITRFFTVRYDDNGRVFLVNIENTASFTEETALEVAERLIESGEVKGKDGNYYYMVKQTNGVNMLIYLDCTKEFDSSRELLIISVIVAAASLIIEFILLSLFSGRMVKPAVDNINKQKVFITDASHELKTPLTIISANIEVLELTEGSNEWTESIKKQTGRMTKLVNDMVYLSKMDEGREELMVYEFELSEAIADAVLSFKAPIENKGISFESSFDEDINFYGDEAAVRQLVSILMDNALKYVDEKGVIRVTLKKKNKHSILEIFNTCESFTEEDLKHMFDRFYRVDKSRSRETGGSGIGLSVAKAIVNSQKNMSIEAKTEDYKSICFIINFK